MIDTSRLMVSVSGLRGRVGDGLTPEVVTHYAAAFGAYVRNRTGERTVVLGRDSRVSGPMFAAAATAGLQSTGCDVVDIGVAPTPTVQLAVEERGAAGGLAVTASHNPVEWNALKFIGPTGTFLDGAESAAMHRLVEEEIPRASWDELGERTEDDGAISAHIERIVEIPFLDVEAIRAKKFRVALDCVRGAGGPIFLQLLERLGCEVVGINMEADGRFPRAPEPVKKNLAQLEALVREHGADVGFATDPDVDRLVVVSEKGEAVIEDATLALAATLVLRHRTGAVVTNLSTSRLLEDVATRAGATLVRAPVGEINVARRMEAEGAVIGGEGNGGVILPDVHLGRDAPVGAALILQLLVELEDPLSAIVASLGHYEIVKEKVDRPRTPLDETYATLERELAAPEVDRQDGIRLDWPEERRWVHLRPSGTEPIVRIIAEAPRREDAEALVRRIREAMPS